MSTPYKLDRRDLADMERLTLATSRDPSRVDIRTLLDHIKALEATGYFVEVQYPQLKYAATVVTVSYGPWTFKGHIQDGDPYTKETPKVGGLSTVPLAMSPEGFRAYALFMQVLSTELEKCRSRFTGDMK